MTWLKSLRLTGTRQLPLAARTSSASISSGSAISCATSGSTGAPPWQARRGGRRARRSSGESRCSDSRGGVRRAATPKWRCGDELCRRLARAGLPRRPHEGPLAYADARRRALAATVAALIAAHRRRATRCCATVRAAASRRARALGRAHCARGDRARCRAARALRCASATSSRIAAPPGATAARRATGPRRSRARSFSSASAWIWRTRSRVTPSSRGELLERGDVAAVQVRSGARSPCAAARRARPAIA